MHATAFASLPAAASVVRKTTGDDDESRRSRLMQTVDVLGMWFDS